MTDTTAPSLIRTLYDKTAAIVLDHYGKALNLALGGIVTYLGMWVAGLVHQPSPPPPAPKIVEIVRTAPDTGSTLQRLDAIEAELKKLTAPKAKRKAEKK